MLKLKRKCSVHILLFSASYFMTTWPVEPQFGYSATTHLKVLLIIGFVRESDGKWIKLFKCVFIVIGEGGHILHWKFTRGESFEEVRDIFIQLKERLQARSVVIDNYCKWKSSLTAIFPDVDIRLDLFHAVQRFFKTIPVGASIGKEYGLVFRRLAIGFMRKT